MPRANSTSLFGIVLLIACCSAGCRPSDQNVIGQANQVHGSLEPAVIDDAEVQRYIDAIGERIVDGAQAYNDEGKASKAQRGQDNSWMYDGSVQWHLVNSKTLNAFTTGGQHIYIYNQLFQDAKSEDELAAVMAHEFAHVYGRHVHSGMQRQYGVMGATLAGAALGYVAGGEESGGQYAAVGGGAAGGLATFFAQGYTRQDESEADKLGFWFYVRAGYDPDKFADFFKHMIAKGYDRPSQGSDHPALSERVKEAEARVAALSAETERRYRREPIAAGSRFRAIQERAVAVARNTPSDQTLAAAQLMLQAFPSCVTPEDQPDQQAAQQKLLRAIDAPPQQRRQAAER